MNDGCIGLTAERVRELLDYDPETGVFQWKEKRGRAAAGSVAGMLHYRGYVVIGIDGGLYRAHRVAWLHFYGEWPQATVDHRDRVKGNNAIANLRLATHAQNAANGVRRRRDGLPSGVTFVKRRGKYQAQISVKNRYVFLGHYDSAAEAHAAYVAAAIEHHGEFAAHLISGNPIEYDQRDTEQKKHRYRTDPEYRARLVAAGRKRRAEARVS